MTKKYIKQLYCTKVFLPEGDSTPTVTETIDHRGNRVRSVCGWVVPSLWLERNKGWWRCLDLWFQTVLGWMGQVQEYKAGREWLGGRNPSLSPPPLSLRYIMSQYLGRHQGLWEDEHWMNIGTRCISRWGPLCWRSQGLCEDEESLTVQQCLLSTKCWTAWLCVQGREEIVTLFVQCSSLPASLPAYQAPTPLICLPCSSLMLVSRCSPRAGKPALFSCLVLCLLSL